MPFQMESPCSVAKAQHRQVAAPFVSVISGLNLGEAGAAGAARVARFFFWVWHMDETLGWKHRDGK